MNKSKIISFLVSGIIYLLLQQPLLASGTTMPFMVLKDTTIFENMIFIYDTLGQLAEVEDANGLITKYEYNDQGKLVKENFSNNTSKSYTYDQYGNVIETIDENGVLTKMTYDENNRLLKKDFPGINDDVFQYDKAGQIILAYNRYATVRFSYDEKGRIIKEMINDVSTNYLHSEDGKSRTIFYPNGRVIQERRDEKNQIDIVLELKEFEVTEGGSSGSIPIPGMMNLMGIQFKADTIASFDWTKGNQLTHESFPVNGTATSYTYDPSNRITSIYHQNNEKLNSRFVYREDGRFDAYSLDSTYRETYQFNEQDHLLHYEKAFTQEKELKSPAPKISIDYDDMGNRISQNVGNTRTDYITNERGAYTEIMSNDGAILAEYDQKGNLKDDGFFHYEYDAKDQLIAVDLSYTLNYPGTTINYFYDPFGRKIAKTSGRDTIHYFYEGDRMIEIQEKETVQTFIYNADNDEVLNMQTAEGDFYFHQNRFGSIEWISDANGHLVERYSYTPNGEVTVFDAADNLLNNSEIDNPFSYQGMYWDNDIGLYENRGNYYTKKWGRAINREATEFGIKPFVNPVIKPSSLFYESLDEFKYCANDLGCGSTEESVLVKWADRATNQNGFIFKDGIEFIKRLEDYSDENCCIDKLIVISHGWGWPRTKGSDVNGGVYGTKWINGFLGDIPPSRKGKGFTITKKAQQLSDLELRIISERIQFCEPCEIILTGCRVASTGNFVERLAAMTGCTVTASHGGCDGTTAPVFNSAPKTLKERNSGEYKGFSITYPNGQQIRIGDTIILW